MREAIIKVPENSDETALIRLCALLIGKPLSNPLFPNDWEDVVGLALRHDVGPMLLWALAQGAQPPNLPDVLRSDLRAAVRSSMVHLQLLKMAQEQINAAFSAANIPAI